MNEKCKMADCVIHNNDCLEELKSIPDESVQLVLMDLPFGTVKNTTACKWDNVIPFGELWPELKRILKQDIHLMFCIIRH